MGGRRSSGPLIPFPQARSNRSRGHYPGNTGHTLLGISGHVGSESALGEYNSDMQDLNLMAIYAHVVASGSFSAAALRLGTSRSAVSKAVAKLEHSLGVRLLHRSTRHLSVTEVGAVFVEHCNRIVEEMVQAEQVASSLHAQPRGTLRVAASVAFGTLHVAPALADFLGRYPDLDVDMTISDRSIDLAEEGYDVIVRVASELPLSVVARQLAPVRRKLCATPEYFARHGLPRIPQDLSRHNCLDYTHSGEQGVSRASGASPDCVFHPNSATHNDRNPPPVTTPSRPPIPPAKPPPIPIKKPARSAGSEFRYKNRRSCAERCAPSPQPAHRLPLEFHPMRSAH